MEKKTVYVEEITSGSYSKKVFTFLDPYQKVIDVAPFLIVPPNDVYKYPHHIDQENFHKWVTLTQSRISEYNKRQGKLSEWGEQTKEILRELINEGIFNTDDAEFVFRLRIY